MLGIESLEEERGGSRKEEFWEAGKKKRI